MKTILLTICTFYFVVIQCTSNYRMGSYGKSRNRSDFYPSQTSSSSAHQRSSLSSSQFFNLNVNQPFHSPFTFVHQLGNGSTENYYPLINKDGVNEQGHKTMVKELSKELNKTSKFLNESRGQLRENKESFMSENVNTSFTTNDTTESPFFRSMSNHFGNDPKLGHVSEGSEKDVSGRQWNYADRKVSLNRTERENRWALATREKVSRNKGSSFGNLGDVRVKKKRRGKKRKSHRISKKRVSTDEKTLADLPLKDDHLLIPVSSLNVTEKILPITVITQSFVPPEPQLQPYSKIRIYNLRIVININDDSGCLRCPVNKIITAKKGMKCAPLLLPTITSCPKHGVVRTKPLRWSLHGNRRVGRILPEGTHTIILNIKSAEKTSPCTFKYQVKVNRCPFPKPVYNGAVDCTQGRAWGSRCLFRCNPGYLMIGNPMSLCEGTHSGVNWTHDFPICREIDSCSNLHEIENGYHNCEPNDIISGFISSGTICTYRCKSGYEIQDDSHSVVACVRGKWNSTEVPACSVVECPKPSNPKHGHLDCKLHESKHSVPGGQECRYICNHGYVIPTSKLHGEFIKCLGPTWNSTKGVQCLEHIAPQPKINMCTDQKLLPNELITKAEFMTNDGKEAEVTCAFEGKFVPGVYENVCEALDPELRTVSTCVYVVEIMEEGCEPPKMIANLSVTCSTSIADDFYSIGTICEFQCPENYVIPTTQLEISSIRCDQSLQWNTTKIPVCKEKAPPIAAPGSCDDISLFLEDTSDFEFRIPKFETAGGSDADVVCNITGDLEFGKGINFCSAWDPELRTNSSCFYEINLQKLKCAALTSPTNAEMSCYMSGRKIYRCDIVCKLGYSFLSQYEDLSRGYVECDVENGKWDFTVKYGLNALPDCLGESTTSLQTDLHFNVTVYDCKNESVAEVQDRIEKGLLSRNRVICDQVDCTDFTFLCDQIINGVPVLETIWNVTANYSLINEDDYYYEEATEAEKLLTEIQQETNKIVSSDESFHLALSEVGASILKESYRQGKIDLICIKRGHVLDPETFKCLQCPTGTFYSSQKCLPCSLDSYQDETGKMSCKQCPQGTVTSQNGTRMKAQCLHLNGLDQSHLGDTGLHDPHCELNPCRNGGVCLVLGRDDFFCYCLDGFGGDFCELPNCPSNFCLNGGTCILERGSYSCSCPSGTAGLKCEIRFGAVTIHRVNSDSCSSFPCMKGGFCIQSQTSDHYYCQCAQDRTGDHCEHAVCPEPYGQWFCLNGGQCVILDDTHAMVCLCKEGYIGSRCEYLEDGAEEITDAASSHSK